MTERLLQSNLDREGPGLFSVTSAGTRALKGHPIDEQTATLIQKHGGDNASFQARQLSSGLLDQADIVLALSREHRSAVVQISPRMLRRTFTLMEFSSLIGQSTLPQNPQSRWASAINVLPRLRSEGSLDVLNQDVADPYRQPFEYYEEMERQVTDAVARIVTWTFSPHFS